MGDSPEGTRYLYYLLQEDNKATLAKLGYDTPEAIDALQRSFEPTKDQRTEGELRVALAQRALNGDKEAQNLLFDQGYEKDDLTLLAFGADP